MTRAGTQFALAHNQFAATHFQGFHNFSQTGFNRNAFGRGQAWNRWGGRFWGAGWNNWGGGWGGWAGPVFWPFLFGDIFTFALWPYDYYDSLWVFGPAFIFASIFAPGPYFGLEYGYGPDYYYYYAGYPDIYYGGRQITRRADRRSLAQTEAAAVESCGGLAPGVTDLPLAQIRAKIRPAEDQVAALDRLGEASARARDVIKASCPSEIPLTPIARLDAAEKRLEAMSDAVQIVREPLADFYHSLSNEQKLRFDAMGAGSKRGSTAGGDLAALCGPHAEKFARLPVRRIEQVVQPRAQQQGAFNDLRQASESATEALQASCPAQMPQTPVARLDAVKTRLGAIVDTMKIIRPKLEAFYASLNDEQKAKFNTMGPPPQSASLRPEEQRRDR